MESVYSANSKSQIQGVVSNTKPESTHGVSSKTSRGKFVKIPNKVIFSNSAKSSSTKNEDRVPKDKVGRKKKKKKKSRKDDPPTMIVSFEQDSNFVNDSNLHEYIYRGEEHLEDFQLRCIHPMDITSYLPDGTSYKSVEEISVDANVFLDLEPLVGVKVEEDTSISWRNFRIRVFHLFSMKYIENARLIKRVRQIGKLSLKISRKSGKISIHQRYVTGMHERLCPIPLDRSKFSVLYQWIDYSFNDFCVQHFEARDLDDKAFVAHVEHRNLNGPNKHKISEKVTLERLKILQGIRIKNWELRRKLKFESEYGYSVRQSYQPDTLFAWCEFEEFKFSKKRFGATALRVVYRSKFKRDNEPFYDDQFDDVVDDGKKPVSNDVIELQLTMASMNTFSDIFDLEYFNKVITLIKESSGSIIDNLKLLSDYIPGFDSIKAFFNDMLPHLERAVKSELSTKILMFLTSVGLAFGFRKHPLLAPFLEALRSLTGIKNLGSITVIGSAVVLVTHLFKVWPRFISSGNYEDLLYSDRELTFWSHAVSMLLTNPIIPDPLDYNVDKERDLCYDLIKQGDVIIKRLDTGIDLRIHNLISNRMKELRLFLKKLNTSDYAGTFVQQAFTVMAYSEPGTGKSLLVAQIAGVVANVLGRKITQANIHQRKADQEFEDGFNSDTHWVVHHDEWNAVTFEKSAGKDVFDILKWVNNVSHSPNMAHLDDKGSNIARTKLYIITTNSDTRILDKYITCPGAFLRRFPVRIISHVMDEYKKDGANTVDPNKVKGAKYIAVYDVEQLHYMNDGPNKVKAKYVTTHNRITNPQLMTLLHELATKWFDQQKDVVLKMNSFFNNAFCPDCGTFFDEKCDCIDTVDEPSLIEPTGSIGSKIQSKIHEWRDDTMRKLRDEFDRKLININDYCMSVLGAHFKKQITDYVRDCKDTLTNFYYENSILVGALVGVTVSLSAAKISVMIDPPHEKMIRKAQEYDVSKDPTKSPWAREHPTLNITNQMASTTFHSLMNKVSAQTYRVIYKNNGDLFFGTGLFIRPGVFVTNQHVADGMGSGCPVNFVHIDDFVKRDGNSFGKWWDHKFTSSTSYTFSSSDRYVIPGSDVAYIRVPRPNVKDLSDYLLNETDQIPFLSDYSMAEGIMDFTMRKGFPAGETIYRAKIAGYAVNNITTDFFMADFFTIPGESGTPVLGKVLDSPAEDETLATNWAIVAVANCSNETLKIAGCCSISKQQLDAAMRFFEVRFPLYPTLCCMPCSPISDKSDIGWLDKNIGGEGPIICGTLPSFYTSKMKTSVVPTSFSDLVISYCDKHNIDRETEYGPPILRDTKLNDTRVGPYRTTHLALRANKCSVTSEQAIRFSDDLVRKLEKPSMVRPLSIEESFNGIEGVRFIDGIDLNTSMGYPWMHKKSVLIKRDAKDKMVVPEEILHEIKNMEDQFESGNIIAPVIVNMPKDEVRKKGKPARMIGCSPLPFTIITRKYFLPWAKYLREQPIIGSCVGLNVRSKEWTAKVNYLLVNSSPHLAAIFDMDYKKYDKSAPFYTVMLIMFVIAAIIKRFKMVKWYKHLNKMWNIAYTLATPLYLSVQDLFFVLGSNPSGNSITIDINIIINLFLNWLTAISIDSNDPFALFLSIFMGDDNLTRSLHAEMTFQAVKKKAASLGMHATTGNKVDNDEDYCPGIFQVDFLKRRFDYDDINEMWLCPLSLDSILRSLTFKVRSKEMAPKVHELLILTHVVEELSLHSKVTRDIFQPLIDSIFQNMGLGRIEDGLFNLGDIRENIISREFHLNGDNTIFLPLNLIGDRLELTFNKFSLVKSEPRTLKNLDIKIYSKFIKMENSSNANKSMPANEDVEENVVMQNHGEVEVQTLEVNLPTGLVEDDESTKLDDFFGRMVRIYNADLTTGFTLTEVAPIVLYLNDAAVQRKLQNYSLFRGDMKLTFTLNASPYLYGKILCAWYPKIDGIQPQSTSLTALSQLPHVILDPAVSETKELVIPFTLNKYWIDLTNAVGNNYGVLFIAPLADIQQANAVTADSVGVTIFASWSNVKITLPTNVPPSTFLYTSAKKPRFLAPTMAKKNGKNDEYSDKPISKMASSVAKLSGYLKDVPIIGPFATATEMGATAIGGIAALFGYSKPTQIDNPQYMVSSYGGNLGTSDGSCNTSKLTYDSKQELSIDTRQVGLDGVDEMSFDYLKGIPAYIGSADWTVADAQDTILMTIPITPCLGGPQTAPYTGVQGYPQTPASMISSCFDYWTGSMVYHIMIASTRFHRGRLRVTWEPNGDDGDIDPAVYNTNFTKIIDLAENSTTNIQIGYGQACPYLSTNYLYSFGDAYNSGCNGSLVISVVNELSAPITTGTVQVLVWSWGGEDLKWLVPKPCPNRGNEQFFLDPTMASAREDAMKLRELCDADMVNFNYDGSERLALDTVHSGESVNSVRTLVKRFGPFLTFQAFQNLALVETQETVTALPHFPSPYGYPEGGYNGIHRVSGGGAGDRPFNFTSTNFMSYFKTAFLGYRGSIRWFIPNDVPNVVDTFEGMNFEMKNHFIASWLPDSQVQFYPAQTNYGFTPSGNDQSIVGANNRNKPMNNIAIYPTSISNMQGISFEIPDYNPLLYHADSSGKSNWFQEALSIPILMYGIDTPSIASGDILSNVRLKTFVAAGEDFSFVFFRHAPEVFTGSKTSLYAADPPTPVAYPWPAYITGV